MHATPTTQGPLDRLPKSAQHLLLALFPVLAGWAGTDVVPNLQGHGTLLGLLALTIQAGILWATKITREYGAGAPPAPWDVEPDPTAPEDEPEPDPTVPSPRTPTADEDVAEAA